MSAAAGMTMPTWIERLPRKPLCDVPWLGRSVILSDGDVHFCCFSEAVVGNVNQMPLQEVWRGEKMRRIREALVAQTLPPECRSNACPFFRGDDHHYILDRMHGGRDVLMAGADDPRRTVRERFGATALASGVTRVAHGERLNIKVEPYFTGGRDLLIAVDVFVSVTFPDGTVRFLPEMSDYPLPCLSGVGFDGGGRAPAFDLLDTTIDPSIPTGTFEICAAFFFHDSDPTIPSNCLWSARRSLVIEGPRR